MKRFFAFKWLWLTLLILILDQMTKYLVTQSFQLHESLTLFEGLNLTLVYNTGAAFSFLQDAGGWQRWFFIILTPVVAAIILVWMSRLEPNQDWLAAALALVLGGAAGNFTDRVIHGYVIDFIDVYYQQWHWPAFNVADSAITVGAVLLVIDAIWLDHAHVGVHTGRKGGRDGS
ncbi:MAG: signal peptidase II [Gammaproteobacteria bacterium]